MLSPKSLEDVIPLEKTHGLVSGAPSSLRLTQGKQSQNISKGSAHESHGLTTVTSRTSNDFLGYKSSCSLQNISKPYFDYIEDNITGINMTFFKLSDSKVSEIPMSFPSQASHICSRGLPSIVFAVPSVVNSSQDRLEIRQTWASDFYGDNWEQTSQRRIAFFFGSSGLSATDMATLRTESEKYRDIVIGDFHDTYTNLSLKMAVTISWVAKYCPDITLWSR
ncbi:hypothetical protein EGW08_013872 [Elysia chlorotica]|uniref:Hexosyltransferase n=1 Tax=Elysia chlorotica TaxID=188477 RepID=A0A3S1BDM7_ELYCH|nr:hypothetical protein EGW08_013872 [Elysia chlorotica]